MTHIRSPRCWPKNSRRRSPISSNFLGIRNSLSLMLTLIMTLAELSVLQKLRTMLKSRISAVMFVTKFTSATSALSWQINPRVDGARSRSICRMTWCLIQMMRSVLGKLRPALSGKEINGNRKIVKGARPAPSATFPNPRSDTVTNTGSNFRSFNRISTGPRPTYICFGCSEQGHWRRNCPKIIIKQTAK